MINAPSFTGTAEATRSTIRVRLTSGSFWALFAAEALLILGILWALISVLPQRPPLSADADASAVREAVLQRISGSVQDPLLQVAPGVTAPASSVRGFATNGTTYYYYFEGQRSFDPFSRRVVAEDGINIVLRDKSGPSTLVIYTLRDT